MGNKEALHRLIEGLPEGEAEQVFRFLVSILEEGTTLNGAPWDDEPVSAEENNEVLAARREAEEAGTISLEEMKRR